MGGPGRGARERPLSGGGGQGGASAGPRDIEGRGADLGKGEAAVRGCGAQKPGIGF